MINFRTASRSILLFVGITIIACSKSSDPAPLGAETNAKFLAGEKGKSKGWKLTEFSYSSTAAAPTPYTLDPCFMDNVYTFTNNDAQSYSAAEGASKCSSGDPTAIESGTWSFTLDGFGLNVNCNNSSSPNGLFSSEIISGTNAGGGFVAYNFGLTPYPFTVSKLDASNMVLETTEVLGSSTYKYKLTFFATP